MNHIKVTHTGIDVRPIQEVLERMPDLWTKHTFRQSFPGTPHKDTETIYLRGPEDLTQYQTSRVALPWLPAVHPLMSAVDQVTAAALHDLRVEEVGYAMLVKLKPGGWVEPHIDEGLYSDSYSRFHLVIADADGEAVLDVDPDPRGDRDLVEKYTSRAGDIIWFNHKALHTAVNMHPNEDRIHLIFDATVPALGKPLYPR